MTTKKKVVKKPVRMTRSDGHQRSVEQLSHFRCASCNKWWSVGDAPLSKKVWHCPWCGTEGRT